MGQREAFCHAFPALRRPPNFQHRLLLYRRRAAMSRASATLAERAGRANSATVTAASSTYAGDAVDRPLAAHVRGRRGHRPTRSTGPVVGAPHALSRRGTGRSGQCRVAHRGAGLARSSNAGQTSGVDPAVITSSFHVGHLFVARVHHSPVTSSRHLRITSCTIAQCRMACGGMSPCPQLT